jgi:Na+/melibiose symporter-like transporter
MTARHTGRDRYATTPAHYAAVGLAILVTICLVIGTAAGPRAGLTAAALVVGLSCAGVVALVLVCLAVDETRTARHRRARRRAGLDGPVDAAGVKDQALAHLTHRLDQEA